MCWAELLLEIVSRKRKGAQLFEFHLGALSTTFLCLQLSQLTCLPAHSNAESSLSVQSLLQVSHLPHDSVLQPAPLSVATEGFLCSKWKRRGRKKGEWTSSTHRVSDEILQGASLDKLRYQIESLILVQHTDELQNVGMFEASHHFDLEIGWVTERRSSLWLQADYLCNQFLLKGEIGSMWKSQPHVFSQDWDIFLKTEGYNEVSGACGVLSVISVLSVKRRWPSATDYQPPLKTFSGSPHRNGSAPSSPSPLPWLYESPVGRTKAYMYLSREAGGKYTVKKWREQEADLDGLSKETFS